MPDTAPERDVTVATPDADLPGFLDVPSGAAGLVLFAHGSGSSRHSSRNAAVAEQLREAGLATLLFDLLTDAEGADRNNVFDIPLLAFRLRAAADWTRTRRELEWLPLGYFGASTGAAAALLAAPGDDRIRAIVSRGGRPDLAGDALPGVRAPTLLIVGGNDHPCIPLNEQAAERLTCEHELAVVPGATHLFEEPGTLERVADLARDWFQHHLASGATA